MKHLFNIVIGLCLLLALPVELIAEQSKNTVPVTDGLLVRMRDSGYTMGDQINMQAKFTLATGQQLDPDSLPLAGRVSPWLDLVNVGFAQSGNVVTLNVVWQIFATVEIAQPLTTPPVVLKTLGKGAAATTIQIPPQSFYYSPVLPLPPLKDIERRKNHQPPAFDTTTPCVKTILCLSLLGLLGLVWAWVRDALPWWPYKPGPMTRLARQLKPLANQNQPLKKAQLKTIHQALNESAGVSLYADDLALLFHNAPYFTLAAQEVTEFTQQSWQHFYAPTQAQPITTAGVYTWVKKIAMAERIHRKQTTVNRH